MPSTEKLNVGDYVEFRKCSCGDGGLTSGNIYEVLAVKHPLFKFIDDNGTTRIRNINSRCFRIYKER